MSATVWAVVAQAAPLLACGIILLFLRARPSAAAAVAIGSLVVATVTTGLLVALVAAPNTVSVSQAVWLPIESGPGLAFGVMLDVLSTTMAFVVAAITLLVMIYSVGYMKGDPGYGRYFGFLAFFAWAMLGLVLASNLLQTLVFWELVGLASFLLIGFWFERPEPAAAARKAFIMTRVGDVGFLLGVLWLISLLGNATIPDLLAAAPRLADQGQAAPVAALLLMGVIGKSAQGPLFTWLPDAMEGPTPVSALLHSATMVAAGVFLVARLHGLFMAAPTVMTALLWLAVITALASATMAMVADDIKRVLAYSSISQLAYMLMGLAAGSVAAGFFHLVTHAGFKALLFMAAGIFIHHAHSNEMRKIATHPGAPRSGRIGLLAGSLALAGIVPFSGFFSKEAVLATLGEHAGTVALVLAYAGAGLTAYYSFRMVFLTTGAQRHRGTAAQKDAHGHGAPSSMAGPVLVLSVLTLALGWLGGWFAARLSPNAAHHGALALGVGPLAALTLAGLGILLAWREYGAAGASRVGLVERLPKLRAFFADNWYLDRLYRATFVRLTDALSAAARWHDRAILDGASDGVAKGTVGGGRILALLQTGYVQMYVASLMSVVAALGVWLFIVGRS